MNITEFLDQLVAVNGYRLGKIKFSLSIPRRLSRGIDPHFLYLCTSWGQVVNFTPLSLPPLPLNYRIGSPVRPKRKCGHCVGKSVASTGIRTPDHPTRSLIAIPTALPLLWYEYTRKRIFITQVYEFVKYFCVPNC